MSGRATLVAATTVAIGFLTATTAGQDRDAPQAVFGVRTDLISVDTSVLDADRKPVRGLTAEDFQVFEDGQPRPIVAFSTVDIPSIQPPAGTAAASAEAPWVSDVPQDVVTNAFPEEGRLVVIVLDRSIPIGAPMLAAQRVARTAVEQLGAGDLAAVVRSSGFAGNGDAQSFTADRALLLRALDSMAMGWSAAPKFQAQAASPVPGDDDEMADCQCGLCVLETLDNVADALSQWTRRRKIILFVGSTVPIEPPVLDDPCYVPVTEARARLLERVDVANVTFNIVDPAGLFPTALGADYIVHAGEKPKDRERAQRGRSLAEQERLQGLRVLPEHTGGRLVSNSNTPEAFLPAIFDESRTYYLLGFEPGARPDGELHTIDVRVNRHDVTVRARTGYRLASPTAPDGASGAGGPGGAPAVSDLMAVLNDALPRQGLRLSASVASFAQPTGRPPVLAVLLGASVPPGTPTARFTTLVAAFDLDGRSAGGSTQTVELPTPVDGSGEVREGLITRLELPPGRYEIRAAVRDEATGTTGSVFAPVDVPDFDAAPVALSSVVFRSASPPLMPGNPLADTLPFVPTVARSFTPSEQALAYLRVHQAGRPIAVSVRAQVLDTSGRVQFEDAADLPPDQFATGDAEYGVALPLATLTPGDYLLRITGTADGQPPSTREARFRVEP